ncbi:MAG: glycosyltransferase [Proteobacteria bacterium]|nr:glycosyltransferase [Pseudomonadota bacterium]
MFSVVMPTRNRAELLRESIGSVLRQQFQDFEIIVVDDCSDQLLELDTGPGHEKISVLRQNVQQGPSAARNAGVAAARGQYIAFLDDDDLWMPWTLAVYAEAINRHGQPAWITSNGVSFDKPSELEAIARGKPDERVFPDYLAYRTNPDQPGWLLPTGVVLERQALAGCGGFDSEITHHEDEDLWLRLGVAPGFVRIASPVCWGYRSHPGGASLNLPRRFSNLPRLFVKERRGIYPGGPTRRRERIATLTQLGRHLARLGAREGYSDLAWKMYGELFRWNLELRRWVFLLAFPFEGVLGRFRSPSRPKTAAGS